MGQPRSHPSAPATGAAAEFVAEPAVDLRELLVFFDRGCPPGLAVRILAPLDPRGPRC